MLIYFNNSNRMITQMTFSFGKVFSVKSVKNDTSYVVSISGPKTLVYFFRSVAGTEITTFSPTNDLIRNIISMDNSTQLRMILPTSSVSILTGKVTMVWKKCHPTKREYSTFLVVIAPTFLCVCAQISMTLKKFQCFI